MNFKTPQCVRTPQEEATFYVSPIDPRNPEGRRWWETMDKQAMKQKMFRWLKLGEVQPEVKEEILKIVETL